MTPIVWVMGHGSWVMKMIRCFSGDLTKRGYEVDYINFMPDSGGIVAVYCKNTLGCRHEPSGGI